MSSGWATRREGLHKVSTWQRVEDLEGVEKEWPLVYPVKHQMRKKTFRGAAEPVQQPRYAGVS